MNSSPWTLESDTERVSAAYRPHLQRKFRCCVLLQMPCIAVMVSACYAMLERVEGLGSAVTRTETLALIAVLASACAASQWLDRQAMQVDALLFAPRNVR